MWRRFPAKPTPFAPSPRTSQGGSPSSSTPTTPSPESNAPSRSSGSSSSGGAWASVSTPGIWVSCTERPAERAIDALVRSGAAIDAFGVGTKRGVSADYPSLDTAYKLVRYRERPVMKLSRDKVTAPGRKQVFRRSKPFSDVLGLHEEQVPAGRQRLLEPLMTKGKRRASRPLLPEALALFQAERAGVPAPTRDLRSPQSPPPRSTEALRRLSAETKRRLLAGLA